jgi:hypothetical protein
MAEKLTLDRNHAKVLSWPIAAGYRFKTGLHFSIETDEPVGLHSQQQIPDILLPAFGNCGRGLPRYLSILTDVAQAARRHKANGNPGRLWRS